MFVLVEFFIILFVHFYKGVGSKHTHNETLDVDNLPMDTAILSVHLAIPHVQDKSPFKLLGISTNCQKVQTWNLVYT